MPALRPSDYLFLNANNAAIFSLDYGVHRELALEMKGQASLIDKNVAAIGRIFAIEARR
jgi:hypothetical protein